MAKLSAERNGAARIPSGEIPHPLAGRVSDMIGGIIHAIYAKLPEGPLVQINISGDFHPQFNMGGLALHIHTGRNRKQGNTNPRQPAVSENKKHPPGDWMSRFVRFAGPQHTREHDLRNSIKSLYREGVLTPAIIASITDKRNGHEKT